MLWALVLITETSPCLSRSCAILGSAGLAFLSNNPQKSRALIDAGIDVVEQVPCEVAPNPHSFAYLQTKKEKMGHALIVPVDRMSAQDAYPEQYTAWHLSNAPLISTKTTLTKSNMIKF
jgi:hypothetical protein